MQPFILMTLHVNILQISPCCLEVTFIDCHLIPFALRELWFRLTQLKHPPAVHFNIYLGQCDARPLCYLVPRWQLHRAAIASPYGEHDSTIAPQLRFFAAVKKRWYKKKAPFSLKTSKKKKNAANRKICPLPNITIGDLLARLLKRYLHPGPGRMTYAKCKRSEVLQCNLGYHFMAFVQRPCAELM